MPGTFIKINQATDTIVDTTKTTAGYFSNGSGKLFSTAIYSSSLSDTNEKYYYGITNSDASSATTQFTVAYGHYAGSGSITDSNDVKGPSQAVYSQWASTLLPENEITGGFFISSPGSSGAVSSGKDEDVYVMLARRSLFKERFNKGNWTVVFSGSLSGHPGAGAAADGGLLKLTDDSKTVSAVATPAGPRFNIVSGSDGTVATGKEATVKRYGFFYPEVGALVFSAAELSASLPGAHNGTTASAVYDDANHCGFGTYSSNALDGNNALRMINCLRKGQSTNTYIQARSEEDQTSVSYFCRVTANEMNFSNNPTFVSGSANEIRHTDLKGNPVVYITGVGLYNTSGQLVAISKLSTPLKKNFSSEATIKVKLTY